MAKLRVLSPPFEEGSVSVILNEHEKVIISLALGDFKLGLRKNIETRDQLIELLK